MSGALPRFSDTALADAAVADATGTDITGAAAAQWAALGLLGDDTSDAAFEPAAEAAPASAPEPEACLVEEAQPAELEAAAAAEPQAGAAADLAADPVSPALVAADGVVRRLSDSPDSGRWASAMKIFGTHPLHAVLPPLFVIVNRSITNAGGLVAKANIADIAQYLQCWSEHGASGGHADARPDTQHHGEAGRLVCGARRRCGVAVLQPQPVPHLPKCGHSCCRHLCLRIDHQASVCISNRPYEK